MPTGANDSGTHTHVQRDSNQHRLSKQDLKRLRDNSLDVLSGTKLLPLHRSEIAGISRLLPQALSFVDKQDWNVCFGDGEYDHEEAHAGEN